MSDSTNLFTYTADYIDDLAAFNWWTELTRDGDMIAVFGAPLTLGEFFGMLRASTVRVGRDDAGWWLVTWTLPLFRGGSFGLWVRKSRRQSPSGLRLILRSLDLALNDYPVLVNTCTDSNNARKTVALGYTLLGSIPTLALNGGSVSVLHLTREAFDARWPRERYT